MEPLAGTGPVMLLRRGQTEVVGTSLGTDSMVAAVAADGRVAAIDDGGALRVASAGTSLGRTVPDLEGERVTGAAFAPGEDDVMVVVVASPDGDDEAGAIEVVGLDNGRRTVLVRRGWAPRWLP
jgi:hypothetical protein